MALSPDGQHLLLARGGDEAWLRDLKPESATLDKLKLRAEVLSCTSFDSAAGPMPLDEAGLNSAWAQCADAQTPNTGLRWETSARQAKSQTPIQDAPEANKSSQ